jgi:hypothetical protein
LQEPVTRTERRRLQHPTLGKDQEEADLAAHSVLFTQTNIVNERIIKVFIKDLLYITLKDVEALELHLISSDSLNFPQSEVN